VQADPPHYKQGVPLQEIPAAAEGKCSILPGVVRKQGERERDGERPSRDQPLEVFSVAILPKGGSRSGACLRLVDRCQNRFAQRVIPSASRGIPMCYLKAFHDGIPRLSLGMTPA